MQKDSDGHKRENQQLLARRLANEVGIPEEDALDLIKLIGTDWNSLLREALFLKNQRRPF
ncbi:hypothetical protein LB542_15600 [Mesorhizobium sp. BR1-1-9]|uniref:hypothetical protein n=1 Tax=unclassified Mesorhizobium TaxID=325217 RepID=UPI00112772CC|nr:MULTISPECIES: hypothetical protein [unclassified Mesorhizobium]MBZ9810275.1 hypothetical protein [Mesorhizobium sp. ESP-6-2]MBZ9872280.1 hypothetical protein [Mesorhizobium sp. BR1-1-9]MBZ9943024.1 hypothetical protein [Mesorhizobium sp. BR1-1-13]TPM24976.1 hypothetical protein FJ955_25015 [Mesorhizobium sp. B2-2-2]